MICLNFQVCLVVLFAFVRLHSFNRTDIKMRVLLEEKNNVLLGGKAYGPDFVFISQFHDWENLQFLQHRIDELLTSYILFVKHFCDDADGRNQN